MRIGPGGLALAAVLSLACGRLKPAARDGATLTNEPDASAPTVDAAPDAPAPGDTGPDDATPGEPVPDPTAVPPTGRALPADVRAPVRIADARALLVGNGPDACTNQSPPSGNGDRWCAFTFATTGSLVAELWVLDVTRAAKGDFPACDGTDAGCLRLTTKASLRFVTSFEGDTLFYGTDSTAPVGQDFLGRLFAWRPGWSTGRQVSSDAGFTCIGNTRSAAAACLDDPAGDPKARDSANVRAGYLTDETGGPLPAFGRYPLRNDNYTAWQADFSPDGSVFVLSDADSIGAKQTLRLSPTSQIGQAPPTLAINDAFNWHISNDGQHIYFFRGADQQPDLYVADFPSGANVTLVDTTIKRITLIGSRPVDQAVEIQKIRPIGGTIELLTGPGAALKTLFSYDDFLNGAILSPDLRYTTWLNDNFQAVVFRNSDLAPCAINAGTKLEVYKPTYLASASLMFWMQPRADIPNSDFWDAFFAAPELCAQKTRFARNVDPVIPIGDRGLVLIDELDTTKHGTLKYVAVTPDLTSLDPAGPVRVHEHVGVPLVLVGDDPPLLVYPATGATPETSGLYVFGPVPF
jgi:hypothetical protein